MSEKRQQISLKEKKKYVLLIKQGANLDWINFTYRKKYGLDLPRSSYYKWKKNPCPDRVCYHYTNSPRSQSRFWNATLSEIGLSAANPTAECSKILDSTSKTKFREAEEFQEIPPSQCLPKSPPKKQSKITAFLN